MTKFIRKPSKNNLHHLFHSFRSIFLFSSVMYLQYPHPLPKETYTRKIIDKSEAVYFFHVSYFFRKKGDEKHTNLVYTINKF